MSGKWIIKVSLIIILIVAFFTPVVNRGLELEHNATIYVKCARNIVQGNGFAIGCVPHLEYIATWQPIYSILIAILLYFKIHWYTALVIVAYTDIFIILVLLSVVLKKLETDIWQTCILVSICLLHPVFLRWCASGYSEPTSWVWLLAGEYFLLKLIEGNKMSDAVWVALFFSLGFYTKYSFTPVIITMAFFPVLFYLINKRHVIKPKNLAVFFTIFVISSGAWFLRNYLLAGKPIKGHLYEPHIYTGIIDSLSLYWKIFVLKRPDNPYLVTLAFLFIPFFIYRFWINVRKQSTKDIFIAFNYLFCIVYTLFTICITLTMDKIDFSSRIYSIMIFSLLFFLLEIKNRKLFFAVCTTYIIICFVKYKAVLTYDSGWNFNKIIHNESFIKTLKLAENNTHVYTPEKWPYIMVSERCIDDNVSGIPATIMETEIPKGSVIVFVKGLYYDPEKRANEILARWNYKKEICKDGIILYN